jgi:hypothetical protein
MTTPAKMPGNFLLNTYNGLYVGIRAITKYEIG